MKGWLDKYGKEINANEGHSSAQDNWVGEGYSNVGRDYSPAWGGQFQKGGKISQAQIGTYIQPPTRSDSLNLYNRALEIDNYYKNKGYKKSQSSIQDLEKARAEYYTIFKQQLYSDKTLSKEDRERILNMARKEDSSTFKSELAKVKEEEEFRKNKKYPNYLKDLENARKNYKKLGSGEYEDKKTGKLIKGKAPYEDYYSKINPNQFKQRELSSGHLDLRSPMPLYDTRIVPQEKFIYRAPRANSDVVEMYAYDPLAVAPFDMLTPEKKLERVNTYGISGTPFTTTEEAKNILSNQPVDVQPTSTNNKFSSKITELKHPDLQLPNIPKGPTNIGWNVEYFDPKQKKTVTQSFGSNEEAEQFYNDPANKASSKYSDASSVGRFQKGGRQPMYTEDPKKIQSYNDSLNLYKAYQFQKNNFRPGYEAWLNNVAKSYPGGKEKLRIAREKNTGKPGSIYKDKRGLNDGWKDKDSNYDPLDSTEKPIVDYYKSLIGNNPNFRIGKHSSPDLWHKTIKPIASYYDGAASPVYKQPVQPYSSGHWVTTDGPIDPVEMIDPSLKKKATKAELLKSNKTNTPGITELQHPDVQIPPIQQGKYRVEYFDPSLKEETHRMFMTQAESDAYADELSKRNLTGVPSAGNITQRVEYQKGGELTSEQLDSLNKAKMKAKIALASAFGNPAARRMMNPTPPSYRFSGNEMIDGQNVVGFGENQVQLPATGTHYMGSMGEYAVPYIQQNASGNLQFNPNASPDDREAMKFDNPQDAEYFAEHYKEVAPMMRNFAKGGNLPQAQKGWLQALQRKLEESIGHPMNRGVDYSKDAVKNKKAKEEDTLRHAYSAMETNKAIQDKTGNIPYISSGLGFLGTNALGVGHELINIFNSTPSELRESGEDVINNFTGSLAGSIPFVSDENKRKAIQYLSDKGILPDGTTAGRGRTYDVINKNKKYAMGGSLPGAVGFTYARTAGSAPSNGPYAKKTKASAQKGKEITYTHEPGQRGAYRLQRTVTPYTSNRDIRRFTETPTDPRQVNFLQNYAGAISGYQDDPGFNYPTQVPYEGDKHWNIDKFVIDPQFGGRTGDLHTTESTAEQNRANTLADMYKYYMLQDPEHKRRDFRKAKRFVRNEVDPRTEGPFLQSYNTVGTENPDRFQIGDQGFDTYANENKLKDLYWSQMTGNDNKQVTPEEIDKLKNVSMDYFRNYKKMSKKEAKDQWKNWEEDAANFQKTGTLANGGSMSYYQHGLDWKPKSMQTGGLLDKFSKNKEQVVNQLSNLPIYSPDARYSEYKGNVEDWKKNLEGVRVEENPNLSDVTGFDTPGSYFDKSMPSPLKEYPYAGTVQLDPNKFNEIDTRERVLGHELTHGAFDGSNFIPNWYADNLKNTARNPEGKDHKDRLSERAAQTMGVRRDIVNKYGLKPDAKIPRDLYDSYLRDHMNTDIRTNTRTESGELKESLFSARNASDLHNLLNMENVPKQKNGGWLDKYTPQAQNGYTFPSYQMPINKTDSPGGISIQEKQKQDAIAEEIHRRNVATNKRQFVGQGKASTPASEAKRIMLNKQYVSQKPNAKIDEQSNVSTINPNMTAEGEPANFMGERQQKGYEHVMGALEAASYIVPAIDLTGAGYNALRNVLGKSAGKAATEGLADVFWNGKSYQPNPTSTSSSLENTALPKITPEQWKDMSGYLGRRQFVKGLQKEGLVGKEFNLGDVNYAARSTKKTDALTKLALDRYRTGYRGVQGDLGTGIGTQNNTNITFDMNRPAYGNTISEVDNMINAGVDFQDPLSIARYQATHIPMETYGYRSGMPRMYKADALYTSEIPNEYGKYQFKINRPTDFSEGNYKDWFKKYYTDQSKFEGNTWEGLVNKNETPTETINYGKDIWVDAKGKKVANIDESFPFTNHKNLTPEQKILYKKYQDDLIKNFNTGWRGQYKQGGVIEDDMGQWAHPGEITEIQGNSMATHGYGDIPLYVVPDVGEPRMIEANTGNHTFPGATKFTEYPINKKPKNGWLDKYN